jgi:hypothetical protein
MSVRLEERRFAAQAAALGLEPDRLSVITLVAFVTWSIRWPWRWLPGRAQRWIFGRLGQGAVRQEIERELGEDDG